MADDERRPRRRKVTAWNIFSPLLRFFQLATLICSFSVLVRSSTNGINWRQYQGFKFLLSGTVIAAFWALCMLIYDLFRLCLGRGLPGLGALALVVLGEWIALLMTYGAGCAGAGLTTFNDEGAFPFRQAACEGSTPFNSFCARTKASVALAFIAFFFFLPSVVWSSSKLAYKCAERRIIPEDKGKAVEMA
ncbi:hypothetical protein KFL_001000280 [Klebsormidium nitens]|uniref:CASP-like protein n=1 Tax=Klebsormidium nitens TaxID=105231 RepID=A0A1Y1I006_KLENI|nr:hypothetical protein KFL_001000280 [Klebsormidium nitens]|eukprot:GAQ82106.1 hypothetical protein KFL_001000280 [Klebsormidium nitens]